MAPLTKAERQRIMAQVACSLCNLGEFNAFWLPRQRKLTVRSVIVVRRSFRLPAGAVFVGVYVHGGVATAEVMSDLDELLERIPEPGLEVTVEAPSRDTTPAPVQMPKRARKHPWRARNT